VEIGPTETTLLMASHHGAESAGSNSLDWIKYVNPKIVLFSSFHTLHGHPRCLVVDRFAEYALDVDGARLLKLPDRTDHTINCGYTNRTVTKALFSTEDSGDIDVELNFDGSGKIIFGKGKVPGFSWSAPTKNTSGNKNPNSAAALSDAASGGAPGH
jgi:hypothetical protein